MAGEQRRLAAIVAADVVGYSRLVGRDESGTVARLRELRKKHLEPALARHSGRLVKLTGDGALVEFPSAVGALAAAIEFQQAVAEANRDEPEDTALVFRIGVHLGDLIVEGDDLYGDGVNVAARLEAEAQAGGVLISRTVHEAVEGRLKATFEDLGDLALKNISRPIRAFRVNWKAGEWSTPEATATAVTAPVPSLSPDEPLPLPDKPSIAVLPFTNMSGDPEQEYFTDGLTEDIITELSRFRSLFVIASNSAFTYKGKAVDVRAVARELGVRYVLEGSCRRTANRIRLTAQLIDAITRRHLWAERFDRVMDDVFAVQEEITRGIVAAIAPELETLDAVAAEKSRRSQPYAHQLALRALLVGTEAYRTGDAALCNRAIDLANEALKLDRECVLGWSALAFQHWQQVLYRSTPSVRSTLAAGMAAARRAIELDRHEHRAHACKGLIHSFMGEHDHALGELRLAHELNPNDAVTLQTLGFVELLYGEPVLAQRHVLESMRLNPKDPLRFNAYSILCNIFCVLGDYAKGIEWGLLSQRDRPDFPPTRMSMMKNYVGLGDLASARTEAERLRLSAPGWIEHASRSAFRRPEDREREIRFRRIALGLEDGPP